MSPRLLLALGVASLTILPSAAEAAPREQNLDARLTGEAERPARETPARGHATFHLNQDGTIDFRLIASNIENVTAAHIHCPADEESNAGVSVTLYNDPDGAGSGRHDGVLAEGNFDPSDFACEGGVGVVDAMRAGLAYVNVHTNDGQGDPNTGPGDFPGGEIRGQIEPRGPSS